MSAAGLPVVTVTHGSSTAGGAYQTGLSDYIIMVRGRSRAFLAGPPLLKAATGEVATEEELGGAEMHTHISGLGDYLAEDDRDACASRARSWRRSTGRAKRQRPRRFKPPRYDAEELLGIMPMDHKRPVDMKQVIARIADDSDFLEFGQNYGSATVCGHAHRRPSAGHRHQQRPDRQRRRQQGHPLHPGLLPEPHAHPLPQQHHRLHGGPRLRRGRHDQARLEDDPGRHQRHVPQITLFCGASFGAGNYGMCGRGFHPRFCFSWPNAKTAVMGGEQAAAPWPS
jgi:geranyl-CoA carboxylase beta subunit